MHTWTQASCARARVCVCVAGGSTQSGNSRGSTPVAFARPARVLSREDRERYFEAGYLGVDALIGNDWLEPLRDLTREFVEASRRIEGRDGRFDLSVRQQCAHVRLVERLA